MAVIRKAAQLTTARKVKAENQIRELQTIVDYETKEYTVELIVDKYLTGLDVGENELYVPEYQRDFVWDLKRQSKFIESVMLGLPIPYVFTSATYDDIDDDEGRVEIVDGSQRVRTLASFLSDQLTLQGLEKLDLLNGFTYNDLELSRRRKFNRRPVRIIELSEKADAEVRRDIFERINTGSDELKAMEKRKGIFVGEFYDFISSCAKNKRFLDLCPLSPKKEVREGREEMVLRFFAYSDRYEQFKHSVVEFLNGYLKDHKDQYDEVRLKNEFTRMLAFVDKHFPLGFRKSPGNTTVPRVRFEAIAVGVNLALRERPKLRVSKELVEEMLSSDEFKRVTESDASNSRPRVAARIEYVRDYLLGE